MTTATNQCDGATHYQGCPCHEARWQERLAAAEARVAELEAALRGYVESCCGIHPLDPDRPCPRCVVARRALAKGEDRG